jgi:hypothetical protein
MLWAVAAAAAERFCVAMGGIKTSVEDVLSQQKV